MQDLDFYQESRRLTISSQLSINQLSDLVLGSAVFWGNISVSRPKNKQKNFLFHVLYSSTRFFKGYSLF